MNNDFVGIDNSVRGINFNDKDLLKQRIVKIVWWNYIMSTQAVGAVGKECWLFCLSSILSAARKCGSEITFQVCLT